MPALTEQIVIACGSIIAMSIVGRLAFKKVVVAIDSYRQDIVSQAEKANKVKEEAEILLKKYQAQQEDINKSVAEMASDAKKQAEKIIQDAQIKAKQNADLRIKSAMSEIDADCENMLQSFDKKFIKVAFGAIKSQSLEQENKEEPIDYQDIEQNIKNAKIWH